MGGLAWAGRAIAGLGFLALAACDLPPPAGGDEPRRPPSGSPPEAPPPTGPSEASKALASYYSAVQADLLAQGLLRTGGGGVDTPYTNSDLARNFERIVFYDEYAQGAGLRRSSGRAGRLRKWIRPVRIAVEFGRSVPEARRGEDTSTIRDYAARLRRVTGHPISTGNGEPNFHVLIMSEDDRDEAIGRILQLVPDINPSSLALFRTLPRSIHCLVVAFSSGENDYSYRRAIAFIRAEHPDLMRRSCVHEEIAQGLGLANDSPRARPSIFNDDDEFALLTTHDEMLLRLLYDPALRPGMTAEEARPIVQSILAGGGPT